MQKTAAIIAFVGVSLGLFATFAYIAYKTVASSASKVSVVAYILVFAIVVALAVYVSIGGWL